MEIISAAIAVIGVILTAYVTFINFKRQSWENLVSKSRNNWLNDFRDEFAFLAGYIEYRLLIDKKNGISVADKENIKSKNLKIDSYLFNAIKNKNRLYSKINTNSTYFGNEYNESYKILLESIDFNKLESFDFDLFKKLTNLILESEWNKVKNEAGGKKK